MGNIAVNPLDVTGQVTTSRGGLYYQRATGLYGQVLTLTNTGPTVSGPLEIVLMSLTPGVILEKATFNGVALSISSDAFGNPVINVPTGLLASLPENSPESFTLWFKIPATAKSLAYSPDVLAYA
jgi:hypothetical protein